MAKLIPCTSCGAQVSTSAKTCPQCGHPARAPRSRVLLWTLGIFVVLVGAMSLRNPLPNQVNGITPSDPPGTTVPVKKGPTDAEKQQSNLRTARAAMGAQSLRRASKDPESFEMKSIITHPDGAVCYDYRAKNSFNAMLAGSAVLDSKGNMLIQEQHGNRFVAAWNKSCTKADGDDETAWIARVFDNGL